MKVKVEEKDSSISVIVLHKNVYHPVTTPHEKGIHRLVTQFDIFGWVFIEPFL
jgi:hypothetical protein